MKRAALLLAILFLSSCKFFGTDVGNPMSMNGEPDCREARCVVAPMVQMLSSAICEKVETCGGAQHEHCYKEYRVLPGLNHILGLGLDIDTFEEFEISYNKKEILVDTQKYTTCMNSVTELSCDSEGFKSVYDIGTPLDFSALHGILETDQSCLESFSRVEN